MAKKTQTVDTLSRGSVAEFRKEAWSLYIDNMMEMVVNRLYFTWSGVGLVLGLLIFSIAGLGYSLHSFWGVLVGAVLAFLLGKRIRRVFREAAKTRRDIIALGQEIEDLGERGEIPMTPPDWSQKMHRPLPLPGDKVTIRGSLLL